MAGPRQESIALFPPTFEPWAPSDSGREVAVLMSGGVDSSMAALLLQQEGWDVLGITMKIPVAEECDHPRPCCGADAGLVCGELGIAHYFLDVAAAFDERVVGPFRRAYSEGLTPNPCVDCNADLKFGVVWDYLEGMFGLRHLATGHYARVVERAGRWALMRAADEAKDQSYFLYGIRPERLPQLVLPLGELGKQAVRSLAQGAGLDVSEKPESMELCFAGEGDYRRALPESQGGPGGAIVDAAGEVIGQHEGISNYTIGQRRGLRLASSEPLYVIDICPRSNSIVVGTREEASRRTVAAGDVNALAPEELRRGADLWGKIRSSGRPSPCTLTSVSGPRIVVEFETPQFAPSPGQHLVLYDEDGTVVGGGTIQQGE